MTEAEIHHLLLMGVFALAGVVFAATGLISAPYGRHARRGWGPTLSDRVGWIVMESPAVFLFAFVYSLGSHARETVPLIFCTMWLAHYAHRSLWYPLRRRDSGRRMPAPVVAMGFVFNALNAYINARWISELGPLRTLGWLVSFRFLYGFTVFATGYFINRWADARLRRLRRPGDTGYKIPRGGLFDEVSCPNYLGELLMWIGWSIATWSLAGLSFAVFTAANLVPRAVSHHRWYRRRFPDYPKRRKAIIPYLV